MTSIYNIAGYTRISVDDEQTKDNISIENQKAIIEDYVKANSPAAALHSLKTGTAAATPLSSGKATRKCEGL